MKTFRTNRWEKVCTVRRKAFALGNSVSFSLWSVEVSLPDRTKIIRYCFVYRSQTVRWIRLYWSETENVNYKMAALFGNKEILSPCSQTLYSYSPFIFNGRHQMLQHQSVWTREYQREVVVTSYLYLPCLEAKNYSLLWGEPKANSKKSWRC